MPPPQSVNQIDLSLGGPIMKDKIWFFYSSNRELDNRDDRKH